MKHIVIFAPYRRANYICGWLISGICDHVNGKTFYQKTRIVIEEKDIVIDIRPADREKTAGLRPTHVLFETDDFDFIKYYKCVMAGRYEELKSIDDVINMVIEEKEKKQ